jgi:hypothetical protein
MNDRFLEAVGVKTEEAAMQDSLKSALGVRRGAKVYGRADIGDERSLFRAEWARLIRDESKRYINPARGAQPSDAEHCQAIQRISRNLSARFAECLVNGHVRFGISQKAFNLYLKYLWCLDIAPMPPHCPIDGIVLAAGRIEASWTKCDSEQQYMEWIHALRDKARPRSLAEWEDQVWLRDRPIRTSSCH